MTPTKPQLLLTGTVVVAVVLGLSRWGTNIGVSPLFICDVLIAFSLAHAWITRFSKGEKPRDRSLRGTVTAMFTVFFAYFLLRFVLSFGQADTLTWLRDGVPFVYALLAFVAAYSLARAGRGARERTIRVFRWALTVHLIWVAAVTLTGNAEGFNVLGPFASAPAFQIRPDIDVALVSIAAALSLRQVILGRRRFWNLSAIALALAVVFITTTSRAGQVSLFVALAAAYVLTYAASKHLTGRRLAMVAAVPIVVGALAFILPQTTAGQRIIATVAPSLNSGSAVQEGAAGTQRARELTWAQVAAWTNEDPTRALFGSGFGNDFLEQAGATRNLEGTTYQNVRSPHNWFVGVYARLGIVGLVLAGAWILQLLGIMWRERERIGNDELYSFAAVTVVAIIPVATLGVVLEAPFGAIPFFWAAGIVMALRRPVQSRARVHRRAQVAAATKPGPPAK